MVALTVLAYKDATCNEETQNYMMEYGCILCSGVISVEPQSRKISGGAVFIEHPPKTEKYPIK